MSGAATLLPALVFVAYVEKTSPFVPNMIAPLSDMQPTLGYMVKQTARYMLCIAGGVTPKCFGGLRELPM